MEQINLNLIPNGILAVCHVSQYDNTGRKIRFHLFNGSDTYALSGTETITLRIRKTNGEILIFDIANAASDYIDLTVLQQMTDVSGVSICEFRLTDSDLDIGSFNFKMKVEPDAFDGNLSISEVSGPIATFETDLAEDLIKLDVDLEPIQDLHGYDNPWPAGGGKNLWRTNGEPVYVEPKVTGLAQDQYTHATILYAKHINLKKGETYTISGYVTFTSVDETQYPIPTFLSTYFSYQPNVPGLVTIPVNNDGSFSKTFTMNEDTEGAYKSLLYAGVAGATRGIGATFTKLQLEKGSTATDWEPVENICPISGHDEVNIARTGKNLLGGIALGNAIVNAVNNQTYSKFGSDANGDFVTITASQAVSKKIFTNSIKFKENTQYTIILRLTRYQTGTNLNSNIYIHYTDGTMTTIYFTTSSDTEIVTRAFVTTLGKTVESIETAYGGGTTRLFYESSGIFEGVLTIEDYEPYAGTEVKVQFGQTVYGGTINLTTGLLRITKVKETINENSELAFRPSGVTRYYLSSLYTKVRYGGERIMCNRLIPTEVTGYDSVSNGYIATMNHSDESYSKVIIFKVSDDITNLEEVKAWLSSNPLDVVYKLETPIEIQLTPQQIEALVGTNVIWADTGDVDVKYYTTLEGGND